MAARRAPGTSGHGLQGTLLMATQGGAADDLDWPLMRDNITRRDLDQVIALLGKDDAVLTQSAQVAAFEEEWSAWLGVSQSIFVNSGSSANLVTLAALRERFGGG